MSVLVFDALGRCHEKLLGLTPRFWGTFCVVQHLLQLSKHVHVMLTGGPWFCRVVWSECGWLFVL